MLRVCFCFILIIVLSGKDIFAVTIEEIGSLPTTLMWWDFETAGHGVEDDLYYGRAGSSVFNPDSFLLNHKNGYQNNSGLDLQVNSNVTITGNSLGQAVYPKRVSEFNEFGLGTSMKFTLEGMAYEKASGDLILPFKRFGASAGNYKFAQFGAGGEFWVRFAMRQDKQLISETDFFKREGDGGHQGGSKRLIIHGSVSSGSLEETIQDTGQRRIPQMYSDSGGESYGAQDVLGCYENDNVTPNDFYSPLNYVEPLCRKFKADQWVVYQVHIKVADNEQKNNGLIELFLNDETKPVIRVTDADHSGLSVLKPYIENGVWDNSGDNEKAFGKLSFTLYSTNKAPSNRINDAHMWIDNIIVSKIRVPKLNANNELDNIKPLVPTGLTVF